MYKMKAQCIVDQYDEFLDKQINKNLNGLLTQSENIADSGGLKQAFKVIELFLIEEELNILNENERLIKNGNTKIN